MTRYEFIKELKKYDVKFKTEIDSNGRRFHFRTASGHCPICALIKAKGIETYLPLFNAYAASFGVMYLGLSNHDVHAILNAADSNDGDYELKKKFEEMVDDN